VYALSTAEFLTLPFGILAPLFHLNLNFNLARSGGVFYNILLCTAAVLSYALTGWITGAFAALCFNIIAKLIGGIDAKVRLCIRRESSSAIGVVGNRNLC
jgi:hypothetical protein